MAPFDNRRVSSCRYASVRCGRTVTSPSSIQVGAAVGGRRGGDAPVWPRAHATRMVLARLSVPSCASGATPRRDDAPVSLMSSAVDVGPLAYRRVMLAGTAAAR